VERRQGWERVREGPQLQNWVGPFRTASAIARGGTMREPRTMLAVGGGRAGVDLERYRGGGG
jgi:hypothetical protein